MNVDGNYISTLLIGAAGVVGWLYTQTQARAKAQRAELRWRRKMDLAKDRYLYRLERTLAAIDMELPPKPEELVEAEETSW